MGFNSGFKGLTDVVGGSSRQFLIVEK